MGGVSAPKQDNIIKYIFVFLLTLSCRPGGPVHQHVRVALARAMVALALTRRSIQARSRKLWLQWLRLSLLFIVLLIKYTHQVYFGIVC